MRTGKEKVEEIPLKYIVDDFNRNGLLTIEFNQKVEDIRVLKSRYDKRKLNEDEQEREYKFDELFTHNLQLNNP